MKEIKKIYRAYSVVYDSNGNNGISVTWYYADTKIYPVKYKDIIKDYAEMLPEIKMEAIKYVDEFFTFDQIKLLKQFIKEEFGTELRVEEHCLPVKAQGIDKDNDEVVYSGFSMVEGKEGVNTIQINRLDNYDLPFKVKGAYPQNGFKSSNDVLDKLKTNYTVHNNMVNQIVPSDQWDEEIMTHSLLKTLAEGKANLDPETTSKLVEALVAGRVHFLPAYSLAGLDIKNLKKITIH